MLRVLLEARAAAIASVQSDELISQVCIWGEKAAGHSHGTISAQSPLPAGGLDGGRGDARVLRPYGTHVPLRTVPRGLPQA